jgi:hypothetical protein
MKRSKRDPSLWGLTLQIPRNFSEFRYKYIAVHTSKLQRWLDIGPPHIISIKDVVYEKLRHKGGSRDNSELDIEVEDVFKFGDSI